MERNYCVSYEKHNFAIPKLVSLIQSACSIQIDIHGVQWQDDCCLVMHIPAIYSALQPHFVATASIYLS